LLNAGCALPVTADQCDMPAAVSWGADSAVTVCPGCAAANGCNDEFSTGCVVACNPCMYHSQMTDSYMNNHKTATN